MGNYPTTAIGRGAGRTLDEVARIIADSGLLAVYAPGGTLQQHVCDRRVLEAIQNALALRQRGSHRGVRYLTVVTKDNAQMVKALADRGAEVRHLPPGAPALGFVLSDREVGIVVEGPHGAGPSDAAKHFFFASLDRRQVEYYAQMFERLWAGAAPAERQLAADKGGDGETALAATAPPQQEERTQVIQGCEEVLNALAAYYFGIKHWHDACLDPSNPLLSLLPPSSQSADRPPLGRLAALAARGARLRLLTEITDENRKACKQLMRVAELRHLQSVRASFALSENGYIAMAYIRRGGEIVPQLTYSNARSVMQQNAYVYETLWAKALPAEQRIRELEQGAEPERTEILQDPDESVERLAQVAAGAKKEMLVAFASPGHLRAMLRSGGLLSACERAAAERGVTVRLLVPSAAPAAGDSSAMLEHAKRDYPHLQARVALVPPPAAAGAAGEPSLITPLLIADDEKVVVWTERQEEKGAEGGVERMPATGVEGEGQDAHLRIGTGVCIYSSSRPVVASYRAVFENLWGQSESRQRLDEIERLQREIINVAAHELRTPIQPILVLAGLIAPGDDAERDSTGGSAITMTREQYALLVRNAQRLEHLAMNILDAARIQEGGLALHREHFDLRTLVAGVIKDVSRGMRRWVGGGGEGAASQIAAALESGRGGDDNTAATATPGPEPAAIVHADKLRISLVLTNLLRNAVRFAPDGSIIFVTLERDVAHRTVTVTVRDSGPGIDPQVMPRLFEKFATASRGGRDLGGMGLGLYVSKKIIEAHGGRMWAENNASAPAAGASCGGNGAGLKRGWAGDSGTGATFRFTLPLAPNTKGDDDSAH